MRRITWWLLSTVAALVLLFSYRTSTMGIGGPESAAANGSADPGAAVTAAGAAPAPAPSASTGAGTVYQGSVAQTRWGPVQVSITVADGRITSVAVPTYPNDSRRDREINARALPILKRATLAAQNADIDTVSGATVTSEGYKESLQSALDAAHLS